MSTALSCILRTLGASARDEFGPFAAAAASHESSNAHTKEDELLVELPQSEEEIAVEEGVEPDRRDGVGNRRGGGAGLHRLGT